MTPTHGDVAHLRQTMKDAEEGWKMHPLTAARFEALGWTTCTHRDTWSGSKYQLTADGLAALRGAKEDA